MPFSAPQMQRRWKSLPGEPVGDAGDPYTGYDRFGRVERMRWGKLGDGGSFSPLVDVSWGHSPASQKTWRKDLLAPPSTAQDQKFDYDALYQLTQRQRGVLNVNLTSAGGVPAQQEDFDYDETGNWKGYRQQAGGASVIEQSRVNNRSNQITQVDGSSAGISYDKNGNMLTVPTGEALTDPSNRIVWDGWNRPAKVYDANDNLLAEYRYDGLGRRVTVASGGVTRHTYYDDQWRSIEQRMDDSTSAERQHVWHPNDRWEMILRDRSTANNGVMDERLYPLKDQLDPVALADDTGNVVERFSYTAFGIPTFLDSAFIPQAPTHAWDFLFHAEFQDAETGWFNYGYRYYVPTLGRWPSRDPIEEEGGSNLYAILTNDLLNRYDSLGLVESKLEVVRGDEFALSSILGNAGTWGQPKQYATGGFSQSNLKATSSVLVSSRKAGGTCNSITRGNGSSGEIKLYLKDSNPGKYNIRIHASAFVSSCGAYGGATANLYAGGKTLITLSATGENGCKTQEGDFEFEACIGKDWTEVASLLPTVANAEDQTEASSGGAVVQIKFTSAKKL